jgi:hypothetical protein
MKKVNEVIADIKEKSAGKGYSQDAVLELLKAVLTDEDHMSKNVKKITKDGVIFEDNQIAKGFKKLLIKILAKAGLKEDEANNLLAKDIFSKKDIKAIMDAVNETYYLYTSKAGKSVRIFRKEDCHVTLRFEAVESYKGVMKLKDKETGALTERAYTVPSHLKMRVKSPTPKNLKQKKNK